MLHVHYLSDKECDHITKPQPCLAEGLDHQRLENGAWYFIKGNTGLCVIGKWDAENLSFATGKDEAVPFVFAEEITHFNELVFRDSKKEPIDSSKIYSSKVVVKFGEDTYLLQEALMIMAAYPDSEFSYAFVPF